MACKHCHAPDGKPHATNCPERTGKGAGAGAAGGKGGSIELASKTVGEFLQKNKASILQVIPRHMDPERLLRVGIACIARSKQLQMATVDSLVKGIVQSAVLGLELDVNGEAYLLPFKNGYLTKQAGRDVYEATFIPGYKGLIKLALQSRMVESIHAAPVYQGDEFDFDEGDQAFVHHKRKLRSEDELRAYLEEGAPAKPRPIAYYAATRLRGAKYPQVKVIDPFEVEETRLRSRAKDNGPWVTDYAAMGTKTVLRRASKHWPSGMNPNLTRAIAAEDRAEGAGEAMAELGDLFPELDAIDVTGASRRQVGDGGRSAGGGTDAEMEAALGGAGPESGGEPPKDPPKAKDQKPGREPGEEG